MRQYVSLRQKHTGENGDNMKPSIRNTAKQKKREIEVSIKGRAQMMKTERVDEWWIGTNNKM